MNKEVAIVAGARPNFMKVAPIIRELKKNKNIKLTFIHTGQHYDYRMSELFFKDLNLRKPDLFFGVGGGSHAEQFAGVMLQMEKFLKKHRCDMLLVVGDVNSTPAAAIIASRCNVPIAHVEAGLRSFDNSMPEEINRKLTDSISDILFTTCSDGNKNLINEGVDKNKVHFVGNVMIDTLLTMKSKAKKRKVFNKFKLQANNYALVTIHRPSNVDKKSDLIAITNILKETAKYYKLVFPIHPRTLKKLQAYKIFSFTFNELSKNLTIGEADNIIFTPPLGYLDFLSLEMNSKFVLTDSGGIQEETTVLRIPCITVRENTERPITVTQGTNYITDRNIKKIIKIVKQVSLSKTKKGKIPKFWDGNASKRIVKVLYSELNK